MATPDQFYLLRSFSYAQDFAGSVAVLALWANAPSVMAQALPPPIVGVAGPATVVSVPVAGAGLVVAHELMSPRPFSGSDGGAQLLHSTGRP